MRTKEIIKVLEKLACTDEKDKLIIELIKEDLEEFQQISSYMTYLSLGIIIGMGLGWLAFGYLPTIR